MAAWLPPVLDPKYERHTQPEKAAPWLWKFLSKNGTTDRQEVIRKGAGAGHTENALNSAADLIAVIREKYLAQSGKWKRTRSKWRLRTEAELAEYGEQLRLRELLRQARWIAEAPLREREQREREERRRAWLRDVYPDLYRTFDADLVEKYGGVLRHATVAHYGVPPGVYALPIKVPEASNNRFVFYEVTPLARDEPRLADYVTVHGLHSRYDLVPSMQCVGVLRRIHDYGIEESQALYSERVIECSGCGWGPIVNRKKEITRYCWRCCEEANNVVLLRRYRDDAS